MTPAVQRGNAKTRRKVEPAKPSAASVLPRFRDEPALVSFRNYQQCLFWDREAKPQILTGEGRTA